MRTLRRLLTVLAILFLGLVQTLAAAQAATSACVESCPDDDPGGNCPPACSCTCHHAPRRPAPAEAMSLGVRAPDRVRHRPGDEQLPPAPEPREMLHVPKSA